MSIPHIKNAFENVKQACEKNLKKYYPVGIPDMVKERYEKELEYLKKSEAQDDFEIFRRLREEGERTSQYMMLRGTIGGSFLLYLLDGSRPNPMPAHYYCRKCGHMEIVNTGMFGIDLPEIECPICGEKITGDGFGIRIETVWGATGEKELYFEYDISSEFLPFAKRVLEKLYPDNEVVNYGVESIRSASYGVRGMNREVEVKPYGFAILPEGRTMKDYPEFVTYLEDGEPCLGGARYLLEESGVKSVKMFPLFWIEHLMELQRRSGIYACEVGIQELRGMTCYDLKNSRELFTDENELFTQKVPQNYCAMANCYAAAYNSYSGLDMSMDGWVWGLREVLESSDFQKYPCYTRDDFFEQLMNCGIERGEAYRFSEIIRKGRAGKDTDFAVLTIPESLKNIAKMYLYVSSKAHVVERLLIVARLAYYMKWNSRVYSAVVRKKKSGV